METEQIVVKLFDRIAHAGTSELDREQSIACLQRLLKGRMPSDVVQTPITVRHQDIMALKRKISEVEKAKATSERERQRVIDQLEAQITKLQAQLEPAPNAAPREYYSYDEILQIMVLRFGKHHGIPAALAERNTRLYPANPLIGRITPTLMQQWRVLNRYPGYVAEQIAAMMPEEVLPRSGWTVDERQYLAALYSANESMSNRALAQACSTKFGRLVTECSIKGELNRLRMRGTVSQYRPRLKHQATG